MAIQTMIISFYKQAKSGGLKGAKTFPSLLIQPAINYAFGNYYIEKNAALQAKSF